jgi:NADP-dependent 3-hydroxy acid dehydrogenase YdfG
MKPYDAFSEEEIIKEINRSLFPTLWCCRAVLPEMLKEKSGVIVNVSSIARVVSTEFLIQQQKVVSMHLPHPLHLSTRKMEFV